MIDAKSLRIGNWILDNSVMGEIKLKVESGTFYWVEKYPDSYNPIPLTPEILEKCGFKRYIDLWVGDISLTEENGGYMLVVHSEYTEGVVVKSLHQLQNLVYALTNKELTITL